jgi:tetratricopeptide (TPR) repeat protein
MKKPGGLIRINLLGAYQMQRGNFDQAIRYWNQALAISPALVLVRLNLAVALIRTHKPLEAKAVLEKALEFDPSFTAARELLNKIR